jgi:hypothetical protein
LSCTHFRACPMIGSFFLGFTYCDGRERNSDRNIIFKCSFIGYFFSGVSYYDNTEHVIIVDTKEKDHQNSRQSNLYSGATPPRTHQISIVFRCSVYYLYSLKLYFIHFPSVEKEFTLMTITKECRTYESMITAT